MIFFRGHVLVGAAIEILLLLAAIVATTVQFGKVSKAAAFLMVPYALWVGFASALTWAIWQLNR
jgi:tryptophan-rich sensory protein